MTAVLVPIACGKPRGEAPRLSKPYEPGRRHERFWTDEEKAVLRENYPQHGAAYCQSLLSRHDLHAIYAMAHTLDLHAPHRPSARRPHVATPELDLAIREAWSELRGKGAVAALADRLDVPRWWLTKRATALALTMPHRKEPPWTRAEDDLMRRVPLHTPDVAARIFREHGFNRTPTAIVVRAKRLELSRRYEETFSGRAAAAVLGVNSKTVITWIAAGDLHAGRRGTKRLPQQGGDAHSIERDELRRFVIDNLERIDFRKVDKFQLVELLLSGAKAEEKPARGWSEAEDAILREGYREGVSLAEIRARLVAAGHRPRGASSISMQAKALELRSVRAAPVWSPAEDEIVRRGYEAGKRIVDIAADLAAAGFDRHRNSVQMRAIALDLTRDRVRYWKDEERAIAEAGLGSGRPHAEILAELRAAGFERGLTSLSKLAQKLNLGRERRDWTAADVEVLRLRYADSGPKRVSEELGRPYGSVVSKANHLGISVSREWPPEHRQMLIEGHAARKRLVDIARDLDRPYANVAQIAKKMGLSFRPSRRGQD